MERRDKFRTGAEYDRMITVMTCADDVQRIDEDAEVRMLRVYLDAVAQFRVSNLSVVHGH